MPQIKINDILDIGKIIVDVLERNAAKPSTKMDQSDVQKIAPDIVKSVKDAVNVQVQPVVDNQTNNEPWYKSRIIRGSVVVIATTAWTAFQDFTDGTPPDLNAVLGYVGPVLGAAYAIYGRLTSNGSPAV